MTRTLIILFKFRPSRAFVIVVISAAVVGIERNPSLESLLPRDCYMQQVPQYWKLARIANDHDTLAIDVSQNILFDCTLEWIEGQACQMSQILHRANSDQGCYWFISHLLHLLPRALPIWETEDKIGLFLFNAWVDLIIYLSCSDFWILPVSTIPRGLTALT